MPGSKLSAGSAFSKQITRALRVCGVSVTTRSDTNLLVLQKTKLCLPTENVECIVTVNS